MKADPDRRPRLSINFHLIEACNAKCEYCFATFPHLRKPDRLSRADREALVDLLARLRRREDQLRRWGTDADA